MGLTRHDIEHGFADMGLAAGDTVLIHSSLSRFGYVEGGADAVIWGILDVLGDEGTLVVPTLTGSEELGPDRPPHIDLRGAECWTGRIPETLRKMDGALRSVHPTHSCAALGARAEELTNRHYLSPTPCGVTSPYFRVALAGGKIVMAGCDLSCCTTLHTVEEVANLEYVCQKAVTHGTCIDLGGTLVETPCRLHRYDGPERDYPVLEPILLERGLMRIGGVGESEIRVVNAMGIIETALDQVRFNPLYLTKQRCKKG